MPRDRHPSAMLDHRDPRPFETAEQAWFWFIQAYAARSDGARITAGGGEVARPCEPLDILAVLDRLYRNRALTRDHVAVLGHYGRRQSPPEPDRPLEQRAHLLWWEAMAHLRTALEIKGILHRDRVAETAEQVVPFRVGTAAPAAASRPAPAETVR